MLKVIRLPSLVPYAKALDLQIQLIARKTLIGASSEDYFILLQHEPVIALGRRSHGLYEDLKSKTRIPIYKSPRGGLATYHGPGQLTCYPIIDLKRLQPKLSLETYVCDLNHVMTETLQKAYNLQPLPYSSDRIGLWLPGNKKIGFIGIQAQQWIVSHGFSINLTPECVNGFGYIDPCGFKEQEISVACAEKESRNRPRIEEVCDILIQSFKETFAIKMH